MQYLAKWAHLLFTFFLIPIANDGIVDARGDLALLDNRIIL